MIKNFKNLNLVSPFGFIFILLVVNLSCSKDDNNKEPKVEPLIAKIATKEQTVAPLTKVTLDGSTSTGPSGFKYKWILKSGPDKVVLSNENSAKATFTPIVNGYYEFTLRVYSGSEVNETQTAVIVKGLTPLNEKSFTTNTLILKELDGGYNYGGGYLISEDFTIPKGKTLKIAEGTRIRIKVAKGKGIVVNGNFQIFSDLVIEEAEQKWKGILVKGGKIDMKESLTIYKAGGSAFTGYEAAALTFGKGGDLSITSPGILEIKNSISDIGMVLTPNISPNWSLGNQYLAIFSKIPVKLPISFLHKILYISRPEYKYISLTTPGSKTTVFSEKGLFQFYRFVYYIDGDFTAGSDIRISESKIYMKDGAGIVSKGKINIRKSTIEGLNGADWKGIASNNSITLDRCKIIGAGSAVHNTKDFTTDKKAALYSASLSLPITIVHSEITKSKGYGVYVANTSDKNKIGGIKFSKITRSDISLPYHFVGSVIKDGKVNTWSSSTPVEVRASNKDSDTPWASLGTGKAYLIKDNLSINSFFTLKPGVHLKFQSGKSLRVNNRLVAKGTVDKPIIFEGESNTKGSWTGILLSGQYQMEYCTIKNGGQMTLPGSSTPANLVFGSGSNTIPSPQTYYSIRKCTISGSKGYGAVIKTGKYDPFFNNTTNTFSGNSMGKIKK